MSSIFGGSKTQSSSSNQAYGTLSNALSSELKSATTGSSALASLLGGDLSGFNSFKNATGFDQTASAGATGITGSAAAGGLLRSGSTSKSLSSYNSALGNQYYQNYVSDLLSQAGLGNTAASILSSAGNTSQSSGSSKPGIAGFLGKLGTGMAGG